MKMGYWRTNKNINHKKGVDLMINKVLLIGNLGEKPEVKTLSNGTAVANFSLATTKNWMKDGVKESKTTWHKVKVFGKQAENVGKYLDKGSKAYVEGEIDNRSYEKDGVKKYITEVNASTIQFLNSNKDTNNALKAAETKTDYQVKSDANFASDNIPF